MRRYSLVETDHVHVGETQLLIDPDETRPVFDYEQDTDPTLDPDNTVVPGKIWLNTSNPSFNILNKRGTNAVWIPIGFSVTSSGFDYVQDIDPADTSIVSPGQFWADTSHNKIFRRNLSNTAWVLFPASFDYEQDVDPIATGAAVVAGQWWANTANNTINRRDPTNTVWINFSASPVVIPPPLFTLVSDNTDDQVIDSDTENVIIPIELGLVNIRHVDIPALQQHQTFHFEQLTDPGAVGAGKWWYDETNNLIKWRNAANTAWTALGAAVAPPTPITITDDFNGVDGATFGNQLTWTSVGEGTINRVSNKAQSISLSADTIYRAETPLATVNHYAQAVVNASEETAITRVGLIIRKDATATRTFYYGDINFDQNLARIWQCVNGVYTQLATFSATYTAGTPVTIKLQAVGPTIKLFVNAVERISLVNNIITTGFMAGIKCYKEETGFVTYEDFAAGDI